MEKELRNNGRQAVLVMERTDDTGAKPNPKDEEKRWADIQVPLTLPEALARLTKDELTAIRTRLGIKGVSGLKKQELIGVLSEHIPATVPNFLLEGNGAGASFLKQVAGQGGYGAPNPENGLMYDLQEAGLLFTGTWEGKRTVVMPAEVLEAVNRALAGQAQDQAKDEVQAQVKDQIQVQTKGQAQDQAAQAHEHASQSHEQATHAQRLAAQAAAYRHTSQAVPASPEPPRGAVVLPKTAEVKALARTRAKIGRNDPCPCGSGKKYKKCCLN